MAFFSQARTASMAIKSKTILLAFFLGLVASPALAAQNDEKDVAAIRQVVETVRTSIIGKDKARFTGLFFSENPERVNWQLVNDDARLARTRSVKPDAKKARYIPESNYLSFIDSVVSSTKSSEEVFSNVRIHTDGEIASVDFDYSYLEDGRQTNWGREMWQLVRTENGWKIISVIWTIHDPTRPS
jgi:hypothetical protein